MKIAVIGAGLFGCTAALKLKECTSADVTLYEQEENILKCASGINQYRLHSGYHYPRSKETALQCLDSLKSFKEMYGFCLSPSWVDHYYAISKDNYIQNEDDID
jgi:L-2-hydroxyglutarate oxidase LhgO